MTATSAPEASTPAAANPVLLVYAHPYASRSRACKRLLAAARDVEGVSIHDLYDQAPDFDLDVAKEQRRLVEARALVLLHPIYWYSMPALLKLWFDEVWVHGFAFGSQHLLEGKPVLWCVTTGGSPLDYTEGGVHRQPFSAFMPSVEQTMRFCKMRWLEPFIVHSAHQQTAEAMDTVVLGFSERLARLVADPS